MHKINQVKLALKILSKLKYCDIKDGISLDVNLNIFTGK